MSWFPNYQQKGDSEISNAAFLAAGRALHICHLFESSCKWALQVGEAVDFLDKNEGSNLKEAFESLKNKLLKQTIKSLDQFDDIDGNDINILIEAADARNYIAHEATLFFGGDNKWLTIARLKRLRQEVERLAKGANIAFLWSYEIENKEPGPRVIFQNYPQMVDDWIFADLKNLLEEQENHPDFLKAEKTLLEYDQTMNKRKKKAQI